MYLVLVARRPDLYRRRDDPQELHNLAEVPERGGWRKRMEANVPAGHGRYRDSIPYQKGPKFPEVDLKSPKNQWGRRSAPKVFHFFWFLFSLFFFSFFFSFLLLFFSSSFFFGMSRKLPASITQLSTT